MKRLKRFVLFFISFILFSFVIIGTGLWWAYKNPTPVYQWIESRYLPKDFSARWQNINLSISHQQGSVFNFKILLTDIDIRKSNPFLHIPLDQVLMSGQIQLLDRFVHIHELNILGSLPFRYHINKTEKDPKEDSNILESFSSMVDQILKTQKYVDVDQALLDLKRFKLKQPSKKKFKDFCFLSLIKKLKVRFI